MVKSSGLILLDNLLGDEKSKNPQNMIRIQPVRGGNAGRCGRTLVEIVEQPQLCDGQQDGIAVLGLKQVSLKILKVIEEGADRLKIFEFGINWQRDSIQCR